MIRWLTLALLIGTCLPLAAQQFTYSPKRPVPGEVVSYTYTPGPALARLTDLQGVYLRYSNPLAMRISQPETSTLARVGNALTGEITLPRTNVAGVVLAFQSKATPTTADHNNGHFYPITLHDSTGQILPHALGGQASVLTRTAFPYLLKIKPDWMWAVAQYEREIKLFPAGRPLYWADLIAAHIRENKPSAKKNALASITTYLDSRRPAPTPDDLTNAARLYEQLSEPALANVTRDRIKTVNPTGNEAQKAKAEAIRAEGNLARKLTAYTSFTQAFPASPYRSMLVSSVAEAAFRAGQYPELIDFLARQTLPNTDPALLHSFAEQLTDEGRALPQAEWLASRALAALKQRAVPKNGLDDRAQQLRTYQATLAWAFSQQKKYAPALATFGQVMLGVAPEATEPRLTERLWLTALRASRADSVLPYVEGVVRVGRGTSALRASLRTWQTQKLGSQVKADTYLADLEANYRAMRMDELAESFVNEPAPNFTLTTLDGTTVTMASLRGKVVVLDFWATWCGPCVASFPAMRMAQSHFKNDPNVQFLFVNTREGGPVSRVRSFIDKQPYTGVVPLDVSKRVSEAYGVQGLPTKVIVDPKGRVRYRSLGYNNNTESTTEEITLVIETLKR